MTQSLYPFRFILRRSKSQSTMDHTLRPLKNTPDFVIPAKAGIQKILKRLDSRLHGDANLERMGEIQRSCMVFGRTGFMV